jgi:hypothetical protein
MRLLLIFTLCTLTAAAFGQSDFRKVPVSGLPQNIQDIQNISMVFRWTDSLGDNLLVITKKTVKREDEDRMIKESKYSKRRGYIDNFPKQTIPAFTYHFNIIKDSAILTWQAVGISQTCGDEGVNHVKNWFVVTDLDNNSRAEVWLVYKGECIGDDDHGNMRIIMYENHREHMMNGPIASQYAVETFFDNNFRNSAPVFRKYAVQLWQESLKK